MNFFTFDFETANFNRSSACAIGITAIKDDQVFKQIHQLINPQEEFYTKNIQVHQITPADVTDQPTFGEYWPEISPVFQPKHLVAAHNLTFDKSVLKATLAKYHLPMPSFQAIDTLKTSRHFYPDLPNHKLNTIAEHLGIELNHHQADSDSYACALILLNQAHTFGIEALKPFVQHI